MPFGAMNITKINGLDNHPRGSQAFMKKVAGGVRIHKASLKIHIMYINDI